MKDGVKVTASSFCLVGVLPVHALVLKHNDTVIVCCKVLSTLKMHGS